MSKQKCFDAADARDYLLAASEFLPKIETVAHAKINRVLKFLEEDPKDVTQDQYLRSTALTMAIQWSLTTSKNNLGKFPQSLQPTINSFYDYLKSGKPLDEKDSTNAN